MFYKNMSLLTVGKKMKSYMVLLWIFPRYNLLLVITMFNLPNVNIFDIFCDTESVSYFCRFKEMVIFRVTYQSCKCYILIFQNRHIIFYIRVRYNAKWLHNLTSIFLLSCSVCWGRIVKILWKVILFNQRHSKQINFTCIKAKY